MSLHAAQTTAAAVCSHRHPERHCRSSRAPLDDGETGHCFIVGDDPTPVEPGVSGDLLLDIGGEVVAKAPHDGLALPRSSAAKGRTGTPT